MIKLENGNIEATIYELQEFKRELREQYLQEIKDKLKLHIFQGSECQCCKSNIKANRVELNKSIIQSLESLYVLTKTNPERVFHKDKIYSHFKKQSNTIGKNKLWGFVIQHKGGYYEITDKGNKFLNGAIAVNEYEFVYKDQKVAPPKGIPIPKVTIHNLKKKWK